MSWGAAFIILIIVLALLLLLGQWIAFALGTTGIIILLSYGGMKELTTLESIIWNNANSFVLTSIPLFIFMGELLLRGGIAERFYKSVSLWVNRVPGGLLHANILGCGIFSAVSGSSPATAAAIGSVAIPELKNRGYEKTEVYGTLAAGGTLGILIPPSIAFILYGTNVEVSIAKLFMAGVLPGLTLILLFMLYVLVTNLKGKKKIETTSVTWSERIKALPDIIPIAIVLALIIGGIYSGIMTPTESAAIGAFIAFVFAMVYSKFSISKLWGITSKCLKLSVKTTTTLIFLIIGAQIMSYAMVRTGVARGMVGELTGMGLSAWSLMAIIILVHIVLGFFVDGLSMMLLTLPVLYPIILQYGFDPIWFGVVLVVLIELGQIHPPIGINLFVIQGIAEDNISHVIRGAIPYCIIMLFMILLLCVFPQLATWMPSKM
jgi:C4-dicarboxylate transporter DctM subunit